MNPDRWVLRWFVIDTKVDYFNALVGFVASQREATRFGSADEARDHSSDEACLFGAGGPGDCIGWKAVRLVKKS